MFYNYFMAENGNLNTLGRKIFFLHPSGITQNLIISELAQEEFEVYSVRDEVKLRNVLKKYPDAIVFANINEGMKEHAWEEWIQEIKKDPETAGVDIGIIASGNNQTAKQKYIDQLNVRCGFTVVKPDTVSVIKQLNVLLNNVNAKGRRKYIRAVMDKDAHTTVNLPINGTFVNGVIKDISVVGFSCSFADDLKLTKNKLFKDIQLRLQTLLIKAEGIVFGSRMDGEEKVYVFLMTQRVDSSEKAKIRKYIQTLLQSRMDHEFK